MRYDIVPLNNQYRGIGRSLLATDLLTRITRNSFDHLLNMYYEYLSIIEQPPSLNGFCKLIDFYQELSKYKVRCEVIVYDVVPLKSAFGHSLDFLGIDIAHEMSESLLCEYSNNLVQQFLNKNGLLNLESDLWSVVPLFVQGDVKWDACYVYKVIEQRGRGDGSVVF